MKVEASVSSLLIKLVVILAVQYVAVPYMILYLAETVFGYEGLTYWTTVAILWVIHVILNRHTSEELR